MKPLKEDQQLRSVSQTLALSESPQAEVQALPPVSGVLGFVVGGISLLW